VRRHTAETDWTTFAKAYWDQVEERVRLAGENGIDLDVVFYFNVKPTMNEVVRQQLYWEEAQRRLAKYSNVLIWEVAAPLSRCRTSSTTSPFKSKRSNSVRALKSPAQGERDRSRNRDLCLAKRA